MSEEMVYSFDELLAKFVKGSGGSAVGGITCLEESPIVDVVAVGFQGGQIAIINLLYSEILLTLDQTSDGGPIKSLSFSSDTTQM